MRDNGFTNGHEIEIRDDQIIISRSDVQGRIVFVNDQFTAISGFSEDELLGHPHNIVRHPDMPSAVFTDLWRDLKGGRPWVGVIKNRCKNGDSYWVEAHVSPIFENGVIAGYMSMRRKASRAQIQQAEQSYAAMRVAPSLALSFKHGVLTSNNLADKLRQKYRNAGLTTKIIFSSLIAAIVVLGAAAYFLAEHVTQALNASAHQQLRHDVSLLRAAVAARVESANIEAVEYSKTLSKRVYEAMGGEKTASLAALNALSGQDVSSRHNSIDPFMRDLHGAATIFVLTPNGFKRILTTAVNESGGSAIGTMLALDHPAHAQLLAGKSYVGPARVFDRQYQTSYTPIFSASGAVIGISVIGIDMADQLATLKTQIRTMKIGETGYYYIADGTPGPNFGRMILHPYREGQIFPMRRNVADVALLPRWRVCTTEKFTTPGKMLKPVKRLSA